MDPGAFSGQRHKDGRPQEDPLAVYCFCVCSRSALLGDLLGVSRSRERDLMSVLSIYSLCIVSFYSAIMLMSVDCFGFSCQYLPPPSVWSHLFCGAGHEKRKGEQLEWSLAFTLYIGSFPFAQLPGAVHTARLGRVFFVCIFSLGLCFACLFVLFDLFVSPFFCISLGS